MRIVVALFALSVATAGCEFAPLPGDVKLSDSTTADVADADTADATVADEAAAAEIDTAISDPATETVVTDVATELDVAAETGAEAIEELPVTETIAEAIAEAVEETVAEAVTETAPTDTAPEFTVADVQLPDSCDEACLAAYCGDCLCESWELPDGSSPCPKDCVVCGDGVCGCGETTSCPTDCA